jgi:hypothetical protein
MNRTSLAVPVAAALLALTLAGCGGGDDAASQDAPADAATSAAASAQDTPAGTDDSGEITKDEFVTRANAVCAARNAELASAGAEVDPADADAVATYATDVLVPNVRGQLDDIRALGFPADDAELLDATLTDAGIALDTIESDPAVLTGSENPFAAVNATLTDYGLTECAAS